MGREDQRGFMAPITSIAVLWTMMWMAVALEEEPELPGHEFFNALPEYEQPDYLTFELGRGYTEGVSESQMGRVNDEHIVFPDALDIPEHLVQKFKAMDVPRNFSQNLFNFVQTEFSLNDTGMRTLILVRSVCFDNGVCIDINDVAVGAICCPF